MDILKGILALLALFALLLITGWIFGGVIDFAANGMKSPPPPPDRNDILDTDEKDKTHIHN